MSTETQQKRFSGWRWKRWNKATITTNSNINFASLLVAMVALLQRLSESASSFPTAALLRPPLPALLPLPWRRPPPLPALLPLLLPAPLPCIAMSRQQVPKKIIFHNNSRYSDLVNCNISFFKRRLSLFVRRRL